MWRIAMPPGIVYHERQPFEYYVYAIAGAAIVVLAVLPPHLPVNNAVIVVLLLAMHLLFEETTVTRDAVEVRFGYLLPMYRRTIARADIAEARAETYSPIGEFGGWGIRGLGGNVALNARGNRGVRLTLRDGRRILIGSQRPEELAAALALERL